MRPKIPLAARLLLLVFVIIPALAWAVVRPVRVALPQVGSGVTCVDATVCVDDPARAAEARALYAEAVDFVSRKVAVVEGQPRVVFCATQACADHFGLGKRSAVTVGHYGTVVGPRAWKPYYVRHELIHYEQFRHLGLLRVVRSPKWFVEGMAYGLSEDPRQPLAQPFQSWRSQFFAWYAGVQGSDIWQRARDL
jgi:hypothetical protein